MNALLIVLLIHMSMNSDLLTSFLGNNRVNIILFCLKQKSPCSWFISQEASSFVYFMQLQDCKVNERRTVSNEMSKVSLAISALQEL